MRLKLLLLLAFACSLPALAASNNGPLVVVIDPGHGGAFPHDGAHGPKGLIEKNISLQVSQRLKQVLEDAGATVVLTREDDADISLAQRAQIANEASADLFVSVHCNSMATSADRKVTKGVETYFLAPDPTDAEAKMLAEMENGGPEALPVPKTNDKVQGLLADLALGQARNDSAELAAKVHHQILRRTGAQSRGVRQAPFLVLSGVKMPAILVEIGFISHPAEAKLLAKDKYQQRMAEAIEAGVQEFAEKVLARRVFPTTPEEKAARLAEQQARKEAWRAAAARKSSEKSGSTTLAANQPRVPNEPAQSATARPPQDGQAAGIAQDPTRPVARESSETSPPKSSETSAEKSSETSGKSSDTSAPAPPAPDPAAIPDPTVPDPTLPEPAAAPANPAANP